MQVLEVACGLRHSFFPANKSQKSPFSHNRPLKSTEVGEEMFESSNSKLFWVTCYIAVGCVFFFSNNHLSKTHEFVELVFSGEKRSKEI